MKKTTCCLTTLIKFAVAHVLDHPAGRRRTAHLVTWAIGVSLTCRA